MSSESMTLGIRWIGTTTAQDTDRLVQQMKTTIRWFNVTLDDPIIKSLFHFMKRCHTSIAFSAAATIGIVNPCIVCQDTPICVVEHFWTTCLITICLFPLFCLLWFCGGIRIISLFAIVNWKCPLWYCMHQPPRQGIFVRPIKCSLHGSSIEPSTNDGSWYGISGTETMTTVSIIRFGALDMSSRACCR